MGGVLCREDDLASRGNWERRLGLPSGELDRIVFYHPVAPQLFVGKAHPEEMWKAIGEELNLSEEEIRKLSADFWGEPIWNHDLLDYITSLKGQYKLGVLSDAWITTREEVGEWINNDLFDIIMFSAEEKIRKPDPKYYQLILSLLEVEADESIFVDDRLENVEGAERVGMYAIHYTRGMGIRERIHQITETASLPSPAKTPHSPNREPL